MGEEARGVSRTCLNLGVVLLCPVTCVHMRFLRKPSQLAGHPFSFSAYTPHLEYIPIHHLRALGPTRLALYPVMKRKGEPLPSLCSVCAPRCVACGIDTFSIHPSYAKHYSRHELEMLDTS